MEMFSAGKEASTWSQVTYSSVKEEAREDIMGYKEVEPQKRMEDWNAPSLWGSLVLSLPLPAVVVEPQAAKDRVRARARNRVLTFFRCFIFSSQS